MIARPLAGALVAALLFAGIAGPPVFAQPERSAVGDLNCDGLVDSRDAAVVLHFEAFGFPPMPSCAGSADASGDGRINSIDALLILQLNAGLIPALPAA